MTQYISTHFVFSTAQSLLVPMYTILEPAADIYNII